MGGRCEDPDACVDATQAVIVCGAREALQAPARCDEGRWTLLGPCVDALCDSATPTAVGENRAPEAEIRSERGLCGGAGLERAFTFTPPASHRYRLSTEGLAYGAALYVRATCAAPETELICVAGMRGAPPQVELDLEAGREVIAIVDALGAHGGEIPLQIEDLCLSDVPMTDRPAARSSPGGDRPDFAVIGDEFGAVWLGSPGVGAETQVQFARFGLDGVPRSVPLSVGPVGPFALSTTNGRYTLVVPDAGTPGGLRFLVFDPQDDRIGPRLDAGLPAWPHPEGRPPVPVALALRGDADGQVLVGVERETRTLWLTTFDLNARTLLEPVALATPVLTEDAPALVLLPGALAVSWGSPRGGNDPDAGAPQTSLALFDRLGQPLGRPVSLGRVDAPSRSAVALALLDDTLAAAFVAWHGGEAHVHVQRFDAGLTALGDDELGAPGDLPDAEPEFEAPALAAGSGHFGVGWSGRQVAGRLFSFTTLSVAGARGPAVARFVDAGLVAGRPALQALDGGFGALWRAAGADEMVWVTGRLACAPDNEAPLAEIASEPDP